MALIKSAGVKIGIDPLGGAAVHFWQPIAERYGINATIVNDVVDPTFRFMTADWDGKIRMDCSSPFAMASLIAMRDKFDVAFANDTDADRHGIVTPSGGLMNPNHFLAAAIAYLFTERKWRGCGDRQDRCLELHHRPRRAQTEPQAGRDARRLQMVRRGSRQRQLWFRRRGKRGRLVPEARRHGVDHRQGRPHPGAGRRRNHRQDRARPEPAFQVAHRRARHAPLRAHRHARDRADEECAEIGDSREAQHEGAGRRCRDRDADDGARQRSVLWRHQGGVSSGWFAARPSGTEDVCKSTRRVFAMRRI